MTTSSAGTARAAAPRGRSPSLRVERSLLREGHGLVVGVDEVGRGALAGPVSVGVVVVDAATRTAPAGLRDSKLLLPEARTALVPRLRRWGLAGAVGHASAGEVDALGVVRALRLAGRRALADPAVAALLAAGTPVADDFAAPVGEGGAGAVVLLDGNHDWLSTPVPRGAPRVDPWRVRTRIKADLSCAAVAAASVLAKVERDALMQVLGAADDRYGWAGNKGYSAPDHADGLRRHGPCVQHRRSWRLPSAGGVPAQASGAADDAPASGRMGGCTPAGRPAPSAWERAE